VGVSESRARTATGFKLPNKDAIADWVAGGLQDQALKMAGANEEVYEIIDSLQTNKAANTLQETSTLGATISQDSTDLNQASNNDFDKWNFNVGVNTSGPDTGGNLQITSPGILNDGRTNVHAGVQHYVGGEHNGMTTDPSTLGNVGITHKGDKYNLNFNMNLGHRKPPEFNTNYQMNF